MFVRLLVVSVIFPVMSIAQIPGGDTTFLLSARQRATDLYSGLIAGQSFLYTGSGYHKVETSRGEHPYFLSDEWTPGTVAYDGDIYEKVFLLYDIQRDNLVIEGYNGVNQIELIRDKVTSFTLDKHSFVHLTKGVQDGFYDLLYDGNLKFLARREKSRQKKIKNGEVIIYYDKRSLYYILKNGMYFPVKTKKSVLDLLGEREQDLKQFLSKNRISFNKDRERAIALMAEYFDTPTIQR